MKKTILSFLCLSSTLILFSQAPNNVILVLNIGQSNVVGRAQPDAANEIAPAAGAYWYKQSTNTLETLVDGIGEGISHATDRSMNPMLGKRLKELTGHDVIIVPAGCGNTFINAWLKETNGLYTNAKSMWQAAVSYCNANNITIAAKYAHWLQGENDAGGTETDGYYVMLNQLTNDLISDVGVEKVFATRIGYDPNYTPASNSEKIMKAQKILNYNNPNFIMASYAPPTFTVANGKMSYDLTHHALPGLNQVAEDVVTAIQHYRATGTKIQLAENVASLQSVTNGYINLTQDWGFEFAGNTTEVHNNVTMGITARSWVAPAFSYTADGGITLAQHTGLATSRPFSSATFTLEVRLKMNSAAGWSAVAGNGSGGNFNKLVLFHNSSTSETTVQFSTATNLYAWDLGTAVNMSTYHTLKLTQAGGVLRLYVDGVQTGAGQNSTGTFSMSLIGMGADSHTFDMNGTIDYFRIKDNTNITLPIKFKSFKATNIK